LAIIAVVLIIFSGIFGFRGAAATGWGIPKPLKYFHYLIFGYYKKGIHTLAEILKS
jgi:uncharacterized membrane protein YtjA (UPF0391 family)